MKGRTPQANIILDEGILKSVPEVNMQCHNCYTEVLRKSTEWIKSDDPYYPSEEVRNGEYKPLPESLQEFIKLCQDYDCKHIPVNFDYVKRAEFHEKNMIDRFGEKYIYEYLEREPFRRSIMINISPNWKITNNVAGVDYSGRDNKMRDHLYRVCEMYLASCLRYTRWKYVLECGSEGNFIHAHIVAEINKDHYKSVMAHIKKGNINAEIRKCWNRELRKELPEGGLLEDHAWFDGLKGKYGVKTILINNKEILKDKLNYLIEDLKPESHKNASHPLYPMIIDNWN